MSGTEDVQDRFDDNALAWITEQLQLTVHLSAEHENT